MPQFACASLSSLANQLRENYLTRYNLVFRGSSDPTVSTVENEIIRLNKLISHHRSSCSRCRQHEKNLKLKPQPLRTIPNPVFEAR
jgi:hypothetical protein